MSNQKEIIIGRLVLTGTLKLYSPLMVGTGEDNHSDNDVLLDKKGKPYIPATSIAGVLSHKIGIKIKDKRSKELQPQSQEFVAINGDINQKDLSDFWGTARDTEEGKTSGKQSEIIVSDAILLNEKRNPIIRDQIRMNSALGITEGGAKFDYEIVEPDAEFQFKIEIGYTEKKRDFIFRMIKTIETLLKNGDISFGAKTANGFGKVKLVEPKYYNYDFSKKENVFGWLERNGKETIDPSTELNKIQPFQIDSSKFKISFTAFIDKSLIIGSSSGDNDADKVHIKSAGRHVLTGSSLKGVIRNRATKILNTISQKENDEIEKLKENLFGFVEEEIDKFDKDGNLIEKRKVRGLLKNKNNERVKTQKSKLFVTEEFIKRNNKEINEELQHRIKIDRFTGGTIESALFNSMPIFCNNDTIVQINILISDCDEKIFPNWQSAAGLLLLVLKDLWTGDLPIGGEKNVGRGRLKGIEATITWDDNEVKIEEVNGKLEAKYIKSVSDEPKDAWEELEEFVSALNGLVGKP